MDMEAPNTTDDAPAEWQNANFNVTLTPSDGIGSGVAYTNYTVNGGATKQGKNVSITTDGNHTIVYYSVDNVGNVGCSINTSPKCPDKPSITSEIKDILHLK